MNQADLQYPDKQQIQTMLGISQRAFANIYPACAQLCDQLKQRLEERQRTGITEACVLGVTGGQGTGKTTLCRLLAGLLDAGGFRTAAFSIDDIYLSHADRLKLRADCPYYRYRGPFGTHDVELGIDVLSRLRVQQPGESCFIPVFDKSLHGGSGDLLPRDAWLEFAGRADIIVFEGWCVGAQPLDENALRQPLNEIERRTEYDDESGRFRRRINTELASYQRLFRLLDDLVVLYTPDPANIYKWRRHQEQKLIERQGSGMDEATLTSFVDYYLPTFLRYIMPLGESPELATWIIDVNDEQKLTLRS